MHTTNYYDTFITVADDCPVLSAEVPPSKAETLTLAQYQFDLMVRHPYQYSSDEVIFQGYAMKNGLQSNLEQERALYFSKGQACLRASPLPKRYGWGIHHDSSGKVAIYAMESAEYQAFIQNPGIKKVKAMRSSRK